MSCCGGNCGCGSGCKCGSSFKGCGMHPDLGTEQTVMSGTIIVSVAPVTMYLGESEMSLEVENGSCGCGSKCGSNCSCSSCKY